MASIVLFEEFRGVQLVVHFPGVIGLRISFPLKEILESFVLPKVAMASDGFYLVFRFSIDKVRWGFCEIGTVGVGLDIWG